MNKTANKPILFYESNWPTFDLTRSILEKEYNQNLKSNFSEQNTMQKKAIDEILRSPLRKKLSSLSNSPEDHQEQNVKKRVHRKSLPKSLKLQIKHLALWSVSLMMLRTEISKSTPGIRKRYLCMNVYKTTF